MQSVTSSAKRVLKNSPEKNARDLRPDVCAGFGTKLFPIAYALSRSPRNGPRPHPSSGRGPHRAFPSATPRAADNIKTGMLSLQND
jgi:hypothetical protein